MKKIAVITGANGGFGREFVKLLAAEDVSEIWTIARNEESLNALAREYGGKIRTFAMDLTDRANITAIEQALTSEEAEIQYLINNAGYGKFCAYHELTAEQSLNMLDLNIGALVALCLVCIPFMKKGSHILNIASVASFLPLPYLNLYSASKAFVRNYTRALNVELKSKGIGATAVCPCWMDTPFLARGRTGSEKEITNFYGITTPDKVARRALKDAKKGKDISLYGGYSKFMRFGAKLLPQKTMMKIWLKQQRLK